MYFQLALNVSIITCLIALLGKTSLAFSIHFGIPRESMRPPSYNPCVRQWYFGLMTVKHCEGKFTGDGVILTVEMFDFKYQSVIQAFLSAHKERVVFYRNSSINNESGAKIMDTLDKVFTRERKWEVVLDGMREVRKLNKNIGTKWSIQTMISTMLEGCGHQYSAQCKKMNTFTNDDFKTQSNSFVQTESESFRMEKSFEVPPYSSVEVNAYYDRYSDVKIPFTASVTITGSLRGRQMKSYDLENFFEKESLYFGYYGSKTEKSLTYHTRGKVIGDFGGYCDLEIICVKDNDSGRGKRRGDGK